MLRFQYKKKRPISNANLQSKGKRLNIDSYKPDTSPQEGDENVTVKNMTVEECDKIRPVHDIQTRIEARKILKGRRMSKRKKI